MFRMAHRVITAYVCGWVGGEAHSVIESICHLNASQGASINNWQEGDRGACVSYQTRNSS